MFIFIIGIIKEKGSNWRKVKPLVGALSVLSDTRARRYEPARNVDGQIITKEIPEQLLLTLVSCSDECVDGKNSRPKIRE